MKLSMCIAILVCLTFYVGGASAVTYKSFVDLDYGFYKVIDIGTKTTEDNGSVRTNYTTVNYINKNLTINVGDTVTWINYDSKDWPITIFSEDGLWKDNGSYLKYSYRTFNHTFTNPGTYGISIKEDLGLRQTIIVKDVETPVPTRVVETPAVNTSIPTPVVTLTEVPIVPEKTSTNATPGFGVISVVIAIFLTLYFGMKH